MPAGRSSVYHRDKGYWRRGRADVVISAQVENVDLAPTTVSKDTTLVKVAVDPRKNDLLMKRLLFLEEPIQDFRLTEVVFDFVHANDELKIFQDNLCIM